jgi:hypothetical protein
VPSGLKGVVKIAKSFDCGLALKANGTVVSWPKSSAGPFGESVVPSELTNAVDIAAGNRGCIGIRADRTVSVWPSDPYVPANLTNIVAASFGWAVSLVLTADGRVIAWGDNNWGGCDVPEGLSNVVAISSGYYNIALKADGTITNWGGIQRPMPPVMPGTTRDTPALSGIAAVSAGKYEDFGLALKGPLEAGLKIDFISPTSLTVGTGQEAFFSVSARGASPLSYQWYCGSEAISGGTNKWLYMTNVTPSQAGEYSVVVKDAQGATVSQSVRLYVPPALEISLVPAIAMKGQAGAKYLIQYCNQVGTTNTWHSVEEVTLTNDFQYFADFSGLGQPSRYYRLTLVP